MVVQKMFFRKNPVRLTKKLQLKGKQPDYVLYSQNFYRYEPLAVVESKSVKNCGLDGALEQGVEYADKLKAPFVFATDGVFYKTLHLKDNLPLLLNGEKVDALIWEQLLLKFASSSELDLRPKKMQTLLRSLILSFRTINEILRKQGLTAGYERFSEFATILFLKLFSEKEKYSIHPRMSEIYRWEYLNNIPTEQWLNYISKNIFPEIGRLYIDKSVFAQRLKITSTHIFKEIYDTLNPYRTQLYK